ncbi:MAG: SDR family oxidoreductase [Prolixibacteraceae bacterium]|nr:SDR family oxidoreductase [Prolixibacteraceae bacterium]
MAKAKKISIIGLGWLGLPLANTLLEQGYDVKGTVTSAEKALQISAQVPTVSVLTLKSDGIDLTDASVFDCEVLIINLPPRRVASIEEIYPAQVAQLLPYIHEAGIQRVLFVSSTSVYPEVNREVDELETRLPDKPGGIACLRAEHLLQNEKAFRTTVLRFGGLIGPGRQPHRFMQYGVTNSGGNIPVNLIHLDDCIAIIQYIIEKEIWGEVLNACCPEHPTRREFYSRAAIQAGIAPPVFLDDEELVYKQVSSRKLVHDLSYRFKYQSPLDFFV